MERRFSMNDFEHSLKEHADEFKMVPSKRVWHGIYNDLHPGRRWPSVAMSLSLIFTLVVIGHLNTHNGSQSINAKNISLSSKTTVNNSESLKISKTVSQRAVSRNANVSNYKSAGKESQTETNTNPSNNDVSIDNVLVQNSELTTQTTSTGSGKTNILSSEINTGTWKDIENNILGDNNIQAENENNVVSSVESIREKINVNTADNLQSDHQITTGNNNLKYTKPVIDNINKEVNEKTKPDEQQDKDLAIVKQKKDKNVSWTYFAAPQVNGVSFSGQPIKPPFNNSFNNPAVAINQKDNKVLHNAALGFEAGVHVNYELAKKLKFTTGLHITYSGYNIVSNEVHPTFADLFLRDPQTGNVYSKSYITHYGDGTGQTAASIKNYSFQASMPIGFQYEFLGNDKVQFNTAADFEPSVVIKSKAYILSSDGNNYVNDPDLLRKFNMSSNFGLFATFSSAKFQWQIGPNIRYQWLSTYKKDYTVKEHLIDYGIRIGISPLRK